MGIILLSKPRFDQINCSGRNGTRWKYGVPKRYDIVKRLGTPCSRGSSEKIKGCDCGIHTLQM